MIESNILKNDIFFRWALTNEDLLPGEGFISELGTEQSSLMSSLPTETCSFEFTMRTAGWVNLKVHFHWLSKMAPTVGCK